MERSFSKSLEIPHISSSIGKSIDKKIPVQFPLDVIKYIQILNDK